jgi:hypothetical protein
MSGKAAPRWVRVVVWLFPQEFRRRHGEELEAHLLDVSTFGSRGGQRREAIRTGAVALRMSLIEGMHPGRLTIWIMGLTTAAMASWLAALGGPLSDVLGIFDPRNWHSEWISAWGWQSVIIAGTAGVFVGVLRGRPRRVSAWVVLSVVGSYLAVVVWYRLSGPEVQQVWSSPTEAFLDLAAYNGLVPLACVVGAMVAADLIRRGLFPPPTFWAITGSALVLGPVVNGTAGWWWMAFALAGSPMAPAALWIAPVVAVWADRPAALLAIPIAMVSVGRRARAENEAAMAEPSIA